MTDEQIAAIRKRHWVTRRRSIDRRLTCAGCYEVWPCDATRLLQALAEARADNARLYEALAFAKSVILSGESMADEAARLINGALARTEP